MTTIKLTVSNHLEAALNTLLELEAEAVIHKVGARFSIEAFHENNNVLTVIREHIEEAKREIQLNICDMQAKLDRL